MTILVSLLVACSGSGAVDGALHGGMPSGDERDDCIQANAVETQWMPSFDAESEGAFLSVWGPSANQLWAVGGPDMTKGVAWHFNGSTWKNANLRDGPLLNWVHGVDDVVWMVGNQGRILRRQGDGDFEPVDADETEHLWGVWAASADEAWAVGGDPLGDGEPDPVILHWKDERWTRVKPPRTEQKFRALFKVWGTSATNVFAVGAKGVILHFDGQQWRQQSSGTARDFISLWGRSPSDIMAVGGRANGVVARYDGKTWKAEVLSGEPGLNGVWMNSAGEATVVGARGRILHFRPNCQRYRRETSDNRRLLHAVFGLEGMRRLAVGGTLDRNPPWQGVAIQGDYRRP
ncbi:MAG: hypothetical protein VX589_08280 [Myxococcota bacterium]|nr:hypothetical protein [Myxococcota bacterium]